MILVSACLAGVNCAWDGRNRLNPAIKKITDDALAVAVCPEVLGGRAVPRAKTEIKGGDGKDVLDGKAGVFDENGKDVTVEFINGAYAALNIVKKHGIKKAVLKAKSPSCGVNKIYDGSFKGCLIDGAGVTAALLKREGIICENI
jgi:uncharacterized protein YbbK (DUF523 family)